MTINLRHIILFVLFGLLLSFNKTNAQEVSISPVLNLRNYFSYEILGDVAGKSIVYRDKGYVKEMDVFNPELELVQSAELYFEKRRIDVFTLIEEDSSFQVLYGFFERDSMFLKQRTYNNRIELQDSSVFARLYKRDIRKRISTAVSDNKQKVLLSTVDEEENVIFLLYDSVNKKVEWLSKVDVDGDFRGYLDDIVLSDTGDFLLLINEGIWSSEPSKLSVLIISPSNNLQKYISFSLTDLFKDNIWIDIDNKHQRWLICGTYSKRKRKEAEGYFYISKKLSDFTSMEKFEYFPFDDDVFNELLQGKHKRGTAIENLALQNVLFRNDGGIVFVSEVVREYARRNPYNNYARSSFDGFSSRAWIDFYNEDVLVSSVSPDGSILWNKVLYKKQFSQDDDGIYSSFFIMKSPSRLRFIYNDEIKKNNTVSEYLMDPAGRIARNSLLSTAYQKMKLRFKDAIQISSRTLVVPSERNYDLNLVRITY